MIFIESNKNICGILWILILVCNGVFEYDFYIDYEKVYEFICWDDLLNGCWYLVIFFVENGMVFFIIFVIDVCLFYCIEIFNLLMMVFWLFEVEGKDKFSFDEFNVWRDMFEKYGCFESEVM